MIIDNQLVLSDKQAITGDAQSTNVIDLGAAGRAPGNKLTVFGLSAETFDNLTSLDITVQSSVDEAFTSPVAHQKVSVALADLAAGKLIDLGPLLYGTLQYVRLDYDVVGANPTAGQVTFAIQPFGQQSLPGQA